MPLIKQSIAVMLFEFRRSMSLGRLSAFWVLSLFPPAMVLLISFMAFDVPSYPVIILFLTFIVCILALLLWATPNVYAELENRNWVFLASRPRGRVALLIGKWLAALSAAIIVCSLAVVLCWTVVALRSEMFRSEGIAWISRTCLVSIGFWAIACVNYAALFSLLGVIFQRRAMVIATVYTVLNECVLAFVFALVSKFSIRYHLIAVAYSMFGWIFPFRRPDDELMETMFLGLPLWVNYLLLAVIPAGCLLAASFIIRYRQYITIDEA
jgi:hypothetical protein